MNKLFQSRKPISKCIIKDLNSKYGTYVFHDNKWIKIKSEYNVRNGDKIRFGLDQHIVQYVYFVMLHNVILKRIIFHRMKYIPIVVVVSTFDEDTRITLQNIMNKIDGIYSTEWLNDCTHLCVSEAKVTKKVKRIV